MGRPDDPRFGPARPATQRFLLPQEYPALRAALQSNKPATALVDRHRLDDAVRAALTAR